MAGQNGLKTYSPRDCREVGHEWLRISLASGDDLSGFSSLEYADANFK